MSNNAVPTRIMDFRLEGKRTVGRPKMWWVDCIVEDLEKSGIQKW
jgi:hypothetical protein